MAVQPHAPGTRGLDGGGPGGGVGRHPPSARPPRNHRLRRRRAGGMMFVFLLLAAAFLPMLAEASLARRHDDVLRRLGAREPDSDVYGVMQVAYPCCFL